MIITSGKTVTTGSRVVLIRRLKTDNVIIKLYEEIYLKCFEARKAELVVCEKEASSLR